MHFGADVVGDKAHDALAIGGRQCLTGVGQTLRKAGRPRCGHRG
jgi:hypothetical protein